MAKKSTTKNKKVPPSKKSTPGRNVFLALTLVPLVIGIILVGAWVLELEVLGDSQSQVTVGIFFFLVSFATSNALQKRWRLAAGWGLLAVADLVTLAWLNLAAQVLALGVGLIGVTILGIEFYNQYQQNKVKNVKK
jgi:low temperature requirement protein LtrA